MKFSWKNIENWGSWKMIFFLSRPFWIFFSRIFFSFISMKTSSPFIWGIIYFCNMDGFFTILEKTSSELICTRLYHSIYMRTVSSYCLFSALLNWFKHVHVPFGQNRMQRKLDFCPNLPRRESDVYVPKQLKSR